jgi:endonuclease/exonuclease/phosphatase (EEP) superfamily protein YafD
MVEVTNLRRGQSEQIAQSLNDNAKCVIVAGDFNTPTDSVVFRRFWAPYRNAFSTSGFGFGNTMRPTVRGCRFGVRIDHILAGTDWWPRTCWVGPDVGAEHLPLIADLVWSPDSE